MVLLASRTRSRQLRLTYPVGSLKFYFNNRRDRTASTCTAILCTLCPAITLGDCSYPADSTFTPLTRQHAGRRIEAFPRSWAGIRHACSAPFPMNLLLLSCQWWNIKDSNLEPTGYEPGALTNCANVPYVYQVSIHRLRCFSYVPAVPNPVVTNRHWVSSWLFGIAVLVN